VRVLEVKIFALCFGYFHSQLNTKQRFLPPELPQIENRGNKTRVLEIKIFALCFGYLRSQFMRVLEIKIFALCFCYLCSQFVRVLEVKIFVLNQGNKTQSKFVLPPELLQIENRGNKTQNKYFYHQNSYKLRTEVTKHKINILPPELPQICVLLPLFSICKSSGGKNLCFVFCYLCSQYV
jgi:hypothetical protein